MKKTLILSASILLLTFVTPVSAQSKSENIYQETLNSLQTLSLNNEGSEGTSEFTHISSIVISVDESIEEIKSFDEDDETKSKWIDELEKEALKRIKDILNGDPIKEVVSENTNEVSGEFKNALGTANDYLNYTSFSKQGLYDQLLYEQYPEDAAQYAIDNIDTDWNENALNTAIQYLDYSSFSNSGLYDQLLYEGYTDEQAQYAIDNIPN